MATVSIKVGDNARSIEDTLTLNGSAIDLTGASVELVWHPRNGLEVHKPAVIDVAASGEVSYGLTAADVRYAAEVDFVWHITFGDGTQLAVPSPGRHLLRIEPLL